MERVVHKAHDYRAAADWDIAQQIHMTPGGAGGRSAAQGAGLWPETQGRARMPSEPVEASYFSPDILEFIRLLYDHKVRYVVVGGEAVIHYGCARLTGAIDFFYDSAHENTAALFDVPQVFRNGRIPGIDHVEELRKEGMVIQFGRSPNRIDGVDFSAAWNNRVTVAIQTSRGELSLHYLGLRELVLNKEAASRPRDQEDLQFLRRL